jgi:transitional endoplasmic reticulum ATPase
MILFDEVEDVFERTSDFFGREKAQKGKAWINRLLEENNVPAIWLSNSIECVDPAFVRRFDFVMELPVPNERKRREIVEEACDGMLDARGIRSMAQSENLAPAVISRAASVARVICGNDSATSISGAIELMVGNTLEAQGHARPRRNNPDALPEVYDPAFIRCEADLAAVSAGLLRSRAGRMCLYGPPGTGKTAWGRWLAEQMQCPHQTLCRCGGVAVIIR